MENIPKEYKNDYNYKRIFLKKSRCKDSIIKYQKTVPHLIQNNLQKNIQCTLDSQNLKSNRSYFFLNKTKNENNSQINDKIQIINKSNLLTQKYHTNQSSSPNKYNINNKDINEFPKKFKIFQYKSKFPCLNKRLNKKNIMTNLNVNKSNNNYNNKKKIFRDYSESSDCSDFNIYSLKDMEYNDLNKNMSLNDKNMENTIKKICSRIEKKLKYYKNINEKKESKNENLSLLNKEISIITSNLEENDKELIKYTNNNNYCNTENNINTNNKYEKNNCNNKNKNVYNERLNKLIKENQKYKNEYQNLKNKYQILENNYKINIQYNKKYLQSINNLKNEINEKNKTINNYEEKLNNLNLQLKYYKNNNLNLSKDITKLNNIILNNLETINELKNFIKRKLIFNVNNSNSDIDINFIFNSINSLDNQLLLSSLQDQVLQDKYNQIKNNLNK